MAKLCPSDVVGTISRYDTLTHGTVTVASVKISTETRWAEVTSISGWTSRSATAGWHSDQGLVRASTWSTGVIKVFFVAGGTGGNIWVYTWVARFRGWARSRRSCRSRESDPRKVAEAKFLPDSR